MRSVTAGIIAISSLLLLSTMATAVENLGSFKELTLEISTPSKPILPMESVPLTISVSNRTDHSICGNPCAAPEDHFSEFFLSRPGEEFKKVEVTEMYADGSDPSRELAPGYEDRYTALLCWDYVSRTKGEALFASVGTHKLKTTFSCRGASIHSNTVTITVVEPTGSDAAAWEFLKSKSVLEQPETFFFVSPHRQERAGKTRELEDFVARFPDSRYAVYAWYALGEVYRLGVGREDDAIRAFSKVEKCKDSPYRDSALSSLATISLRSGDTDAANRYFGILKKEYPGSTWIAYVEKQMAGEN